MFDDDGGFNYGVWNLLEKAPSRYDISATPKILEKIRDYYFVRIRGEPEDGAEGSHGVASRHPGAAKPGSHLGPT